MVIKKRLTKSNKDIEIENLAKELADRPYGQNKNNDYEDNTLVRTTITLPKFLLFKLEDMAKINRRKKEELRSVSAIIRHYVIEGLEK